MTDMNMMMCVHTVILWCLLAWLSSEAGVHAQQFGSPAYTDPDVQIALFNPEDVFEDVIAVTFVNTSFEAADYALLIPIERANDSGCDSVGNVIRIGNSDACRFTLSNSDWHFVLYHVYNRSESATWTFTSDDNVILEEASIFDINDNTEVSTRQQGNCSRWAFTGDCHPITVYDDYAVCHPENGFIWSPYFSFSLTKFDCTLPCASNCRCIFENSGLTSICSDADGVTSYKTVIVWNRRGRAHEEMFFVRGDFERIRENAFTSLDFIGSVLVLHISSVDPDNRTLRYVEEGAFNGFHNLTELDLSNHLLTELDNGTFNSLGNIVLLILDFNQIETIRSGVFTNLPQLNQLFLRNNHISHLPIGLFLCSANIVYIFLGYNHITRLRPGVFLGLNRLELLDLSNNRITALEPFVFDGLTGLNTLDLSGNKIRSLAESAFVRQMPSSASLIHVRDASCDENVNISSYTCADQNTSTPHLCPIPCIQKVTLTDNNITDFSYESFRGLDDTVVDVDQDWLCCFMPHAECAVPDTERTTDNFMTCNRLLPNTLSVILLWLFGFLAVIGNLLVIFWQVRTEGHKRVQSLLITNLAFSDFLMGVYLLIIASAHVYYGEYFPAKTEIWRNGSTCLAAGTLALLSSEASILCVTLISIDRLLGIRFMFSRWRMRVKSATWVIIAMWSLALAISLVPVMENRFSMNYFFSEVCMALPLSRREIYTPIGMEKVGVNIVVTYDITYTVMYYSVAVFIGLNSICCLIIAVCYIWIFITIKTTAKHAGRQREIQEQVRMAMKMSLIVLTDFCTWTPLIIIGILVQTGAKVINPEANAWIVTLMMPMNSAINPFMYTLASVFVGRFKGKKINWCTRRRDESIKEHTKETPL